MTRTRKILGIVLAVMILTLVMSISIFADTVAKIGETEYSSVSDAVNAANVGDTVTLLADVETLPAINKAITITGPEGGYISVAKGYGESQFGTIDGTVTIANINFVNGSEAIRTDYLSADYSKLTVKLVNCKFNAVAGYAVMGGQSDPKNHVLYGLVIENCEFNAAENNTNYLVYAQCVSNLTITGTTFNGNDAKGAVHTGDSTAYATVTVIENCTIDNVARGIQIGNRVNGSAITISNSNLTNIGTTTEGKNGAIYLHSNSNVETFETIKIANNTVTVSAEATEAKISVPAVKFDSADEAKIAAFIETAENSGSDTISTDGSITTVAKVATVNGTGYATFDEAITAAKAMTGDVVVEIYDKVTLNANLEGNYDSIKFVGKDTDAEIYLEVQGYITATGKSVAFEGLILSKSTGAFITNAGFMNVAFGVYQVSEVTYTNCTFANGAYASSGDVTFTGCTFYRSHDKYGLWAYGDVNVVVDDCTFADYRGIKMYAEGAAKTTDLTVINTDFSAVNNKPAIVLTYGESVTLEGNTYSSTGVFELDLDGAPNGTLVTSTGAITCKNDNGACGVLVDGKIYTTVAEAAKVATSGSTVTLLHNSAETVELAEGVILDTNGYTADGVTVAKKGLSGTGTEEDPFLITSLEDLIWFRDTVNTYTSDGSNQFKGQYVKLTADIDLDGINWTPIGTNSVGDHAAFLGTFDGDGHTIFNLYINSDGDHLGFFARVGSYAEGVTPTVKNINFKNVDVSSNTTTGHGGSYVAGVIANAGGNSVVSNVHVTGDVYVVGYGYVGGIVGHGYPDIDNCSVKADYGWVNGHYWCVGGIIGYAGEGGTPISNCEVSGIDIWTAYGAGAAIAGLLQDGNKIENVTAEDVTITSNSDYCMGYIAGNGECSTVTNVTLNNVTATANGETITSTDAVASVNGTIYFSLQEAIAAAKSGETIVLLRDITIDALRDVNVAAGVTIDGNGKSLSIGTVGNHYKDSVFYSDGAYTVKNLTISADKVDSVSTSAFNMANGGKLINVTINASFANGVYAANGVVVENCTFNNTTWGVYSESANGVASVTGSTFNSLRATSLYGNEVFANNIVNGDKGLSVATGTATITGNTFNGARAMSIATATNDGSSTIKNNKFLNGSCVEVGAQDSPVLSENYWSDSYTSQIVPDGDVTIGVVVYSYYEDAELTNLKAFNAFEVNGTQYATFAEAYNAANAGDTIKLIADTILKNETATSRFEIKKSLTIDLNGYTIYGTGHMLAAAGGSNVTVTIKGGTLDGIGMGYALTVFDGAKLVIESGTYKGQTSAVYISNGTAEILGGEFSVVSTYGTTYLFNCNDTNYKNGTAKIIVKGGTFNGFDPAKNASEGADTNFVADGYASIKNLQDQYVVGVLPEADIEDLGSPTIDDYDIYNGSLVEGGAPIKLQIALEFIAKDSEAAAKANAFANYTTDFYITITGIEDGSFVADGCYLAGNYGTFGWIMIPLDGMTIEEGKIYPVITSVGINFSYEDICTDVENFKCGIFFSDEVLAQNPNMKVQLDLGLSENLEAAQAADSFVTVTEPLVYDVEDLMIPVAEVNGVQYATLQEAIANANGGTVILLEDIESNEGFVIDSAITIDLNGKTISIVDDNTVVNCVFDIIGDGAVTIKNGTIKTNNGQAIYVGKDAEGNSYAPVVTLTSVTLEGADYGLSVFGSATVTVGSGTVITGSVEALRVWNTAAVTVQAGAVITSEGYAIMVCEKANVSVEGGIITGVVANADETSSLVITGGTYTDKSAGDYLLEGYALISNGDGTYRIGKTPNADVTVLGPTVITDYDIWDGSSLTNGVDPLLLQIVMNFKANESAEEAKANGYGNFLTDFYLTFDGIEDGSLVADNCYIVGNYGAFGWIAIPINGLTIENGVSYPIVSSYDPTLNYNDICKSVKDFTAAIFIDPAILEANPDFEVSLELKMTNPDDAEDVLVVGEPAEYTAEDLLESVVAAVTDSEGNVSYYPTLQDAFAAAQDGDTIKLLDNVELSASIKITGTVTIDLNGNKLTGPDVPATSSYYAFIVDGGNLTLKDSVGGGEIWAKCYGIETKSGSFTMESGTITATNNTTLGSAIVNYGGTVTIKGGTLAGALSAVYAGGYFSDASISILGGTINGVVVVEDWADKDFTETISSTDNTYSVLPDYKWVEENGVYVLTAKVYVAQVGDNKYETLADAIANAQAGDTVTLLADVTIDQAIEINTDITIDLNGKKVTSTAKKAFEVYANATIKNGTIEAVNRCVDTRTAVELTLDNVALVTGAYTSAYGNPQALTIGGYDYGTKVTLKDVSIDSKNGYGIISFVKTELTATNLTTTGFNALYVTAGSEGSVFTFVNCDLSSDIGTNDVAGNSFATIVLETSDITVNVDADSTITATGSHMYAIAVGTANYDVTGNTVTVAGTISGNILAADDFDNNTVAVKAEYADELNNAGYVTEASETEGLVIVKDKVVYFDPDYVNLNLGNDISINFFYDASRFEDENYFAVITKHHEDTCSCKGTVDGTDVVYYIPFSSWKNNGGYKQIAATGIAAKEMVCDVFITIYRGTLENDVPSEDSYELGEEYVDSIVRYIDYYIEINPVPEKVEGVTNEIYTLFADMLAYGTEAQIHFGHYKTVNGEPIYASNAYDSFDALMAHVTPEVEMVDEIVIDDDDYYFYSTNLSLKNTIHYNFWFTGLEGKDVKVEYSFTHHDGTVHTYTSAENSTGYTGRFDLQFNDDGYLIVSVTDLAPADLNLPVTVKLYVDGSTEPTSTIISSVEDHCAYACSLDDTVVSKEDKKLYESIMKYANSANAYLH